MESEFLEIFAVDTLATHQAYDTGKYHLNVQVLPLASLTYLQYALCS